MKPYYLLIILILFAACNHTNKKRPPTEKFSTQIIQLEKSFDISIVDSLSNELVGTIMDEYEFTDINGAIVSLSKIDQPIFFQATASWCKPCIALKPALNEMVKKYHKEVVFILLNYDSHHKARVFGDALDPRIKIIPSLEEQNPNSTNKINVGGFRQIFPFPTTYFINSNKEIIDVKIGGPISSENTLEEVEEIKAYHLEGLGQSIEKMLEQ